MKGSIQALCLAVLFLTIPTKVQSQTDLVGLNRARKNINEKGMLILGAWSLANIGTGAAFMQSEIGEKRYFHQMNMFWNYVNLGIAVSGYFGSRAEPDSLSLAESLEEQVFIEKILLLNTGLDLFYISGGLLLLEHRNSDKRMRGYGRSLIMQGSFLFIFDVALYLFHNGNYPGYLDLLNTVRISDQQISIQIKF